MGCATATNAIHEFALWNVHFVYREQTFILVKSTVAILGIGKIQQSSFYSTKQFFLFYFLL